MKRIMDNYLGDRIYDWRKQNEISQEDFADMASVTRQTVVKWEAGIVAPKSDKLQKISEIIGVGVDELMSGPKKVQPMEEVAADEVVQESAAVERCNDKKLKLSKKSKITIVAIVLLIVLIIGIVLVSYDKILQKNFEGSFNIKKSTTWNFSVENLGWTIFGVSIAVGVILGAILICKTVKRKKKINEEKNVVEPKN